MRVVIVHDWLTNIGGAERLVLALAKAFDAPVYTSVVNPDGLQGLFDGVEVHASFLQGHHRAIKDHRKYFPFMPYAFKHMKLEPCDIVITSSSSCAKGVRIPKGAIHICYCHTPMRYAWSAYDEYVSASPWWKRLPIKVLLAYMRHFDLKNSSKVDYFIANSNETKDRIKKYYDRDSYVIYPGVDTSSFALSTSDRGYYLVLSRFVRYKRNDLAIEACERLGRKLVVTGHGECLDEYKAIAKENTRFVDNPNDHDRCELVKGCRALLFPGREDFGMTPVEAMSSGKPVIAYGEGGALDTVIDGKTGVFFKEQTVDSLSNAILRYESSSFDHEAIREHALSFSIDNYVMKMKEYVNNCLGDRK